MPDFTVLPTQAKVYLRENRVDRVVTLAASIVPPDDGPGLAQALATALGAGFTTSFAAGAGTLGTITIGSATPFVILSRASLLQLSSFAGSPLVHSNLQDASDILGTTTADATTLLTLGQGLDYRRIELSKGSYTMDSLAVELQTQLNSGFTLGTYTVGQVSLTSRLTISNTATLKFHIYPTQHLDRNPFSFQGFSPPFFGSDGVTGFTGGSVLSGNNLVAASHVSVMAYHTLFINSTLGTHSDTIGPVGQSTIARKVVIETPQGSFVHDFHATPFDFLQLEKQSISSIRFRVTDWQGHSVEMSPWSLSIIFVPDEEF